MANHSLHCTNKRADKKNKETTELIILFYLLLLKVHLECSGWLWATRTRHKILKQDHQRATQKIEVHIIQAEGGGIWFG